MLHSEKVLAFCALFEGDIRIDPVVKQVVWRNLGAQRTVSNESKSYREEAFAADLHEGAAGQGFMDLGGCSV